MIKCNAIGADKSTASRRAGYRTGSSKSFDDIVNHYCYAGTRLLEQWKSMSIARRNWAAVSPPVVRIGLGAAGQSKAPPPTEQ
jgi:hypothetical protein